MKNKTIEIVIGQTYDYKAHERQMELAKLMDEGTLVELPAGVFARNPKRKEKENWDTYKRSMRNATKALKIRLRQGLDATVWINRKTMCLV